jgi:hypothetical protein
VSEEKAKPVMVEPRWEDRRDAYEEFLAYVKYVPTRMGHIHNPIPESVAARMGAREAFLVDLARRLSDERSAE